MRRGVKRGGLPGGRTADDGRSLDELDRALLESLDRGFAGARRRAGERLVCRPGCDSCCRTLFPITSLDAARLREGMRRLHESGPGPAREIRERARALLNTIAGRSPELIKEGRLADRLEVLDAAFERHAGQACPALGSDGRCQLYASRPVACRTYGPPLRFGAVDSPPCDLCFVDAGAAEIDRCRFRPDPDGLEQRALARLEGGTQRQVLIAQVLAE